MSMTCSTCIHDGCCAGLPYCGGMYYQSAYKECNRCGHECNVDDMQEINGELYCEGCAEKIIKEEEEGEEVEEEVEDGQ